MIKPVIGIKEAKQLIKHKWHQLITLGEAYAGGVIFLEGISGIGKTAIQKQIADEFSRDYLNGEETNVLVINLAAKESTDFSGLPYIKNGRTCFAKPNDIPDEGYGILFFDEGNRIHDLELKSVMLNYLNDREINGHKLGKNWIMVMAGNPFDREEYDTVEFDTAMSARLINYELSPSIEETIQYLESVYKDHFLIDCLKVNMNIISLTSNDGISPRSYEHAIKDTFSLKDNIPENKQLIFLLLEGILGNGPLEIIKSFLDQRTIISFEDVLTRSKNLKELDRYDSATLQKVGDEMILFFIDCYKNDRLLTKREQKNLQTFIESDISTDNLYALWTKLNQIEDINVLIYMKERLNPFSKKTLLELKEITKRESDEDATT